MQSEATKKPLRLMVTGGGTGGHLFPGIATAEALCRRRVGSSVMFVGTHRKMDSASLARYGFEPRAIHSYGIKGKSVIHLLKALSVLPLSCVEALALMLRFKPDLVVGVGGYVTGPVMVAARLLGKPTLIHEQNSVPGLANRMVGRLVNRICLSIPGSETYFNTAKTRLTGNPVRSQILEVASKKMDAPSTDKERQTLVILGGSLGAHRVNLLVLEALTSLDRGRLAKLDIIHQTGTADEDTVRKGYQQAGISARVAAFFTDMAEIYGAADVLISRAGATTLAELAVLGLPALLIPYPYAADNHQQKNGEYFAAGGGAEVAVEAELTAERLTQKLLAMLDDRQRLQTMATAMKQMAHPEAAELLVDNCLELLGRGCDD